MFIINRYDQALRQTNKYLYLVRENNRHPTIHAAVYGAIDFIRSARFSVAVVCRM